MKKYLLLVFSICLTIVSTEISAQNSVVVHAFLDQDGNGMDDEGANAAGLTNAELFLVESGSGTVYNHVEGVGADYTFDDGGAGLPDGTYTLQYVETPWTPAATVPGSAVLAITLLNMGPITADNDVEPISGISTPFVLAGGAQTEMDIDLGLYAVSAIGDFVWEDINGDGFQDGELANGIDGVTVTLLDGFGAPAVDTDMMPIPAIMTMGGGAYQFGNLPPGDYIVEFSLPTAPGNWFATTFNGTDPDFSNDSDADPNNTFRSPIYTIDNNIIYNENIDAGFVQAVSIGNQVWEDLNGDGIQDPGEPGINGVTVSLFDATGAAAIGADGLAVVPQVTANIAGVDGSYSFIDIAPGQYQVQFSLPAPVGGVAWYPTEFDPGDIEPDDSGMDSDASNNPADGVNYLRTALITVLSAETDEELRIDAGFWLPAMVGNQVFCDENGNGIDDDGVGGVDGVDVTLVESGTGFIAQDADGGNLTTTTAGGGMYMFELVPPGDYFIQFAFTGATPDPPFVFTLLDDPDGLGDDFSDSDANPVLGGTFGQTEEFTVTSQDTDEEEKWDAGVYQVINIIGTVWLEDDGNNTYDGEMGPGGVLIELFTSGNNKVDETFTNAGTYEFIGLAPGDYFIQFNVGGTALESATPCPGSNDAGDMVDNDDNGIDSPQVLTSIFTLLSNCDPSTPPDVNYIDFCYFFDCNEPNLLAATACNEVLDPDIICDISILGTFCNLMPTDNSGGAQPNPLCTDGGAPHNISWFAFVAYGGDYTITVTPTGCSGSTTGVDGVQIGLYTDCTFSESVFCNPNCNLDAVTFDSDLLEEGQTYYFFIDGCSGSVCSYEVEISGNPVAPNLLPQDVCIIDPGTGANLCQDAEYCPDAEVQFIATDFDLTVNFTWEIITVSGVPYSGDANPTTTDEILSITFPDEGVYRVCLTQVDNGCSAQQWNGNICREVTIEGIDDEMFDEVFVCEVADFTDPSLLTPMDPNGDGTIGWQGGNVFTEGTNTFTVTTPEGCMYDQEFELTLFPVSDVGLFEQTVCKDDLPLIIDGTQYAEVNFAGNLVLEIQSLLLVNSTDVNGCDSLIDLSLEILDIFNGVLGQGVCTPDGVILEFQYGLETDGFPSTEEDFITWVWTDPNDNVLADNFNPTNPLDNLAPVGVGSGTYTLTATITKNGVTCVLAYTVDINFDDFLPVNPEISAPGLEVCEADSIVTYTAINFGDAFDFDWTFPSDVASFTFSGANDEILTLNWSGSAGGQVTLITSNACGMSEEVVIDITVIPQLTPAFSFTTEVCVDSCTIIQYVGDASLIDDFEWGFDGGTENNGTGSEGSGPHCVSWSDAGDKTITLTYTDLAGCVSTITTEVVTVIPPLAPPTINCVSQTGEVTFSWDLIAGTTESDYSVAVTLGPPGTLSGTSYTIAGLAVNQQVEITLTILTNDACVEITTTASCVAQDCTPPIVSISAPSDSIFCLNGTDQSFDFIANIPAGVTGSGVYMGTGIIDTLLGTFNPDSASVGINNITYIYNTDDGCTAIANSQVVVFETPVASFTSDVDTICITDQFNLNYDGTSGASSYTWDYGVGGTGSGGPTPSVTFDSPGTKTIRLIVEKDNCVSESVTIDVFVQPELEDIIINCSIQEIDQVQFSWNDIDGATGYLVEVTGGTTFETTDTFYSETGLSPDDMITITVTVLTDSKCPSSTFTQTCTAVSCPTFTFSYDNPVTNLCVDDGSSPIIQLQALASGGDNSGTYTWSGPNVTDDQFDPNGLGEGQFELFVIYEENSCQDNGSVLVNITLDPLAAFSVDMTTICLGETVNILYEGSQLTNQDIIWASAGATVMDGANPNEYTATFNAVGTFDIQLDVVNGDCTTAPFTTTITVEPELEFGMINCLPELDQVTFNWDPVDCATEYEVFIEGISQGLQTTTEVIVSGLAVGTEVDIEVIAISDCACGDVSMTAVCETTDCTPVVLSLFTMDGNTEFCFSNDLAPIEIMFEAMGTLGNGTATWTGANVDQDGMFDPLAAGVGTHTIGLDFLESVGCLFSESITFTIHELPEVTAQFDEILCYDQATTVLTVNPTGGTGDYNITLDGDPADLINDVSAGTYNIVVSDQNQCTDSTSVVISQPGEPMPTISGATELILGDSSTYSIQSNLFDGTVVDSIVWTANGTEICNDAGCFSIGTQTPTETTVYEVTVHYNNGCSVTTTTTVEVTEIEPVSIFLIPNIISPNGDGENDEWQFVTNNDSIVINSVKVFDRWGNNVWEFTGPVSARGNAPIWDGMYNGRVLLPGVYVYFVNFDDDRRQNRIRSGDITIIN